MSPLIGYCRPNYHKRKKKGKKIILKKNHQEINNRPAIISFLKCCLSMMTKDVQFPSISIGYNPFLFMFFQFKIFTRQRLLTSAPIVRIAT